MNTPTSQTQLRSTSTATALPASPSSSLASSFQKLFYDKVAQRCFSDGESQQPSSPSSSSTSGISEFTDRDIDEVVIFLLEKLNDYSDRLNRLSTAKESIEKELKCLHRALLKQTSKIKQSLGQRAQALVEIYFEKMLRLCMRELELRHCFELKSDMEDELHIAGSTIEQFDTELAADIWWRGQNLVRDPNIEGQLVGQLQPPPMSPLRPGTSAAKAAHMEIVQHMRAKMQSICEQLCDLHEKINNIKTRYNRDRDSFDKFCQIKQSDLRVVMPFCADYFDVRLSVMMRKPQLERLSTKIDRVRRTYTLTMNDLYLVSCYIRKRRQTQNDADLELANSPH